MCHDKPSNKLANINADLEDSCRYEPDNLRTMIKEGQDTEVVQAIERSLHDDDASTDIQVNVQSNQTRLRVGIVGGGIGGLALATFLARSPASASNSDLEVSIYEAAESLTELGAGVGVWLRTWRILAAAGLAADLKSIAPAKRDMTYNIQSAFEFRRGDHSPEGRSFYTMKVPFGVLTLHRADFQRILARHAIPPAQPYFGKRLTGYSYTHEADTSSEIILTFADGSIAHTDVLVGADGIHSAVRREFLNQFISREALKPFSASSFAELGETRGSDVTDDNNMKDLDEASDLIEPVWSGTLVYRNLISLFKLEKRFPGHRAGRGSVVYFGRNQHVLAFPLAVGDKLTSEGAAPTPMVNVVAFVSDLEREGTRLPPGEAWVRPGSKDDLLATFSSWEDEVLALLELVEKPMVWAIHTVKPLSCYSDMEGRVVLIGDAAHAMTPHQGAGGGQTIEDAHVLAALLTHPLTTRDTLPAALRAYDTVRRPISQGVVQSSRLNGMMYEFNHAWAPDNVDESDARSARDRDAVDARVDADETLRLQLFAETIMEIHKWEWEDEPEESQTERAVRLFKEYLDEGAGDVLTDSPTACEKSSRVALHGE